MADIPSQLADQCPPLAAQCPNLSDPDLESVKDSSYVVDSNANLVEHGTTLHDIALNMVEPAQTWSYAHVLHAWDLPPRTPAPDAPTNACGGFPSALSCVCGGQLVAVFGWPPPRPVGPFSGKRLGLLPTETDAETRV